MDMTEERIKKLLQEVESKKRLEATLHNADNNATSPFWHILQQNLDEAYNCAYHIIGNEQKAFDLTREVFVTAHSLQSTLRSETVSKKWIMKTIRQRAICKKKTWPQKVFASVKTVKTRFFRKNLVFEPNQKTCEKIRDFLVDYLNDELNSSDTGHVKTHLKQCRACQEEYEELRYATQQIQSVLNPMKAPAELRQQINEKITEREQTPVRLVLTLPRLATAAASFIILIVAGLSYYNIIQELHKMETQMRKINQTSMETRIRSLRGLPADARLFDGQDIVIVTGKQASEGFSPEEAYAALADSLTDPIQTRFILAPGNIESIKTELQEKLQAENVKIIEEHDKTEEPFTMQIISVEIPTTTEPIKIIIIQKK